MPGPENLELIFSAAEYAVCRLAADDAVPGWAAGEFVAVTRSAAELSVVCPADAVPPEVRAERGWRLGRVAGTLDFAETGIVSALAAPLAAAGVPVFVVSTFDTDYLLVPDRRLSESMAALRAAGVAVTA